MLEYNSTDNMYLAASNRSKIPMSTLKWDIERQASSCSDVEFPETAEF